MGKRWLRKLFVSLMILSLFSAEGLFIAEAGITSTENFQQTASISADKEFYQAGETVTLLGSGWLPGETAEIIIKQLATSSDAVVSEIVLSVTADAEGNFLNSSFIVSTSEPHTPFVVGARGLSSGREAITAFMRSSHYIYALSPSSFAQTPSGVTIRIWGSGLAGALASPRVFMTGTPYGTVELWVSSYTIYGTWVDAFIPGHLSNIPGTYSIFVQRTDYYCFWYWWYGRWIWICYSFSHDSNSFPLTITQVFDTTPPMITPNVVGTLGNNSWYVSDVNLSWSVVDPESGVSSTSGCDPVTIATDTPGTTFTCAASSVGGTASSSVTIKRDSTPPTITTTRDPPPNEFGWNNTPVNVAFEASDAMSGIDGIPTEIVAMNLEGANQSVSRTFRDLAGNSASSTASNINIDFTPPRVTVAQDPPPNANGWNNTDVKVTFSATDNLSGIQGDSFFDVFFTLEGAGQTATKTFLDLAGNATTASTTVNIDKTPPQVSCSMNPAQIWPPNHKMVPVTTTVTVTDLLSGPTGFILLSATSSEPDNGLGDGDMPNDIQEFVIGTSDTSGFLRAERSGIGTGRTYALSYEGSDLAGNTASCDVGAVVPHDRRK